MYWFFLDYTWASNVVCIPNMYFFYIINVVFSRIVNTVSFHIINLIFAGVVDLIFICIVHGAFSLALEKLAITAASHEGQGSSLFIMRYACSACSDVSNRQSDLLAWTEEPRRGGMAWLFGCLTSLRVICLVGDTEHMNYFRRSRFLSSPHTACLVNLEGVKRIWFWPFGCLARFGIVCLMGFGVSRVW